MPTELRGGLVLLAAVTLAASLASAAEPRDGVLETEQVRLRLVAEPADARGIVRGAIEVELTPGWKTYWLDPGDAGIPPSVDFGPTPGAPLATLMFPAPHRFGDGFGQSVGYSEPMSIAFTLSGLEPRSEAPVAISLLLGICETICIPMSAELSTTASAAADPATRATVEAAFAALPRSAEGRIGRVRYDGPSSAIEVEAMTVSADVDLFVAGPEGWYFGPPTATGGQGDNPLYSVPVLDRPRGSTGAPRTIDVILTDGGQAFAKTRIDVETADGGTRQ